MFTYAGLEGGNSPFAHALRAAERQRGRLVLPSAEGAPSRLPARTGRTVEGDVTPADVVGPECLRGIEPLSFGEIVRAMCGTRTRISSATTRWPGGEDGEVNDKDQKEFVKQLEGPAAGGEGRSTALASPDRSSGVFAAPSVSGTPHHGRSIAAAACPPRKRDEKQQNERPDRRGPLTSALRIAEHLSFSGSRCARAAVP